MSKNILKKSIKDWKSNATLRKIDADFYLYSTYTLISVEEHAFEISKSSVQASAENCLETFRCLLNGFAQATYQCFCLYILFTFFSD